MMASINQFYSDNLAEEVKKGQRQKIADGGWPAQAPIGYRNVRRDGARRAEAIIEPDPVQAPLVRELFDLYGTGAYTIRELHEIMVEKGLRIHTGKPPVKNVLNYMLTNPSTSA